MSRQLPPEPPGRDLLRGKHVLVTAAAGTGVGFATARRCVAEGATVVISDRNEARLAEAAAALADEFGVDVPVHVPCDVTRQDDVDWMFDHALAEVGHLDVLVNNAGLGGTALVHEMTDEQWRAVLDVTMDSTFRCTRRVLPHFYERRTGAIVNVSSVLGWRAQAGQAHYAAAKAGVMALTRCSAIEAAEYGVRVNAVAPSLAKHRILEKVMSPELLDALESQEAFGRGAATWEVANVIVFLASDLSSYMTGEVLAVSSQHA